MTKPKANSKEKRVLLLAPTGRDAMLTQKILAEAGISSQVCKTMEYLCSEFGAGAGAALMTEEALNDRAIKCLIESLDKQPAWSDFPIILFATNTESAGMLLNTLGERANVIVLERPINISVVTGAIRSALRARRRQYQTRSLLVELEEADRQKDLFLATMSHELRTPLNAILGWSGLLRTGKIDEKTVERAVNTIERNARTQARLIEDILDVSRIIRGNLRLNTGPVELSSMIEAAIDVVRPAAEAKSISLEVALDPETTVIS